ncbi:MAG: hypothetical protein P8182_13965 [Deltaproteobacteria bacterium]
MNSLSYGLMVFLSMILLVQGCGNTKVEKSQTNKGAGTEAASSTESQSARSQKEISPPAKGSQESVQQHVSGAAQGKRAAVADRRVERKPSGAAQGRVGLDEQSRIELMATKALAEYKAKRERERLDKLTSDLGEKEKELETLKEDALAKDREAKMLKAKIEEIQATADKRVAVLDSEMKKLNNELQQVSSEAERLKHEVEDKTGLLQTLKAAATDAGKLKASAESELSRLRAQLDETQQELDKAQSEREEFRQGIQLLQSQVEQSTQERDQYREAAEKLQSEADQARKNVEDLKGQISKLKSELEAFQPASETPAAEASAGEKAQSRVDLILRLPTKHAAPEHASNLY